MKARFISTLSIVVLLLGVLSACAPATTSAPATSAPATSAPPTAAPPTAAPPTSVPVPDTPVPATEAPAPAPQGAASDPSTLIVLTPADTQTLDPAVNYDFSGGFFLLNCYEGLVKAVGSKEAKLVPALAESWQVSPDGLTYTFKLRSGVKFHDGTPLNAEAVKYSFDRLLAMKMGAVGNFTSIDKIEAADDLTVKFILKAPFTSFLLALSSMWGPVIVSPTAVKAHETNGDMGQAWLAENDAGTGPYKVEKWDRNQQLTLVRNPDYWGGWGDKHLEKIIIRFVPETTTMRLMIEKGDADVAVGMSSNEDLDALAKNPDVVVEEFAAMSIRDLRINTTKKPLDDVRVRQALAYSFDYDQAASGVLGGHGVRMDSVTAKGVAGYYKPSFMYTKDLDKAKQLLAEAGHPGGGFSLDYIWLSGLDIDRQIGEMWQADLKTLGIDLKIQEMPLNTWWDVQGKPDTAPQMMMGQWGLDYADATSQIWLMYYSGNFPPSGSNYFYYKNPKVDKLLEQARVETDQAKLDQLYQAAVEMIYTDSPEIWALQTNERIAHRAVVMGYQYNMSYYKEGIDFSKMYKR
jgi:peptide/nickel transport system substrate-binding protein